MVGGENERTAQAGLARAARDSFVRVNSSNLSTNQVVARGDAEHSISLDLPLCH